MNRYKQQQVDKKLVAESFRASGLTYEGKAVVQQQLSKLLVKMLGDHGGKNYTNILEVGCGTGYLTELLCREFSVETIYINDIVEDFCLKTYDRVGYTSRQVFPLPGDIEVIELAEGFDLVVSSATFQWMSDLKSLMSKIYSSIRPGGYLAFSIFAPGTMEEISSITGAGLPYLDNGELKEIVEEEFQLEFFDTLTTRLYFPSVRAILKHIRQTGVGGVGRSHWTVRSLRDFEDKYRKRYQTAEGLPVSYHATFVVAKRGDQKGRSK